MASNVAAIADYHDTMRAALRVDALDAQQGVARNAMIHEARLALLASFGSVHSWDAITLVDSALCLPPIPAQFA
jgi:hypothetical protein